MGTVTLNYAYQFFNQRTGLTDNKGGTTSYTYNDNFQITALNYTQSGSQANVGVSYNTATDDSLSKVTMDAGGGTDHITASYSYSSTSLSIHYTDSSANTLANLVYNIDGDARVSSYTGPEGSLTYAYDADGQLTSVTDTVTTAVLYNYSLDAAGNRRRKRGRAPLLMRLGHAKINVSVPFSFPGDGGGVGNSASRKRKLCHVANLDMKLSSNSEQIREEKGGDDLLISPLKSPLASLKMNAAHAAA